MNDNLINYNIDQVDMDSIEDHKIEPVYNTDKKNTNITPISYQKEENKTSEEIIFNKNKIINNEEQKTDENNIVENKNIENKKEKNEETNKDNHEKINHEEKELYQQRDNFYPQINNNPKEEINNNEGYNGGYYQQYENYELNQKMERNVPYGENIIDPNSYPDEKQIKLHYSHLQIQENSPENDSINPPPNSIQLQSYEEIPNKFPYQIEPLPPQGAGGFPPIQYQIPPNGINGPKFLLPHGPHHAPPYGPHHAPPYGPHHAPPYGPHVAPLYGPHHAPPYGPHHAPPYGPHVAPPYGPHVAPPYGPHVAPPYGPHVASPYGPHIAPPYGPHAAPPYGPHHSSPYDPVVIPPYGPLAPPPYGPHVAPPYGPHAAPPYEPNIIPPYEPVVIPPYGPHISPPHGPNIIPPYGPHISPPHGPPFIFPYDHQSLPPNGMSILPPHGPHIYPEYYGPHFVPPHGPHIYPEYYGPQIVPPHGPHIFPQYNGPHFIPPPNYENQNMLEKNDDTDNESDVGFSSNKGKIEINNYENEKGDINSEKVENMQYNSNDYNINYIPNEFYPYQMDQYNYQYYGPNIWPDYNLYNEGNNILSLEESKTIEHDNIKKINYQRIPLYTDIIISPFLMDQYSLCIPKYNSYIDNFSIPIVIIHNPDLYKSFNDFLNKSSLYKGYNSLPILKNKLILSKIELNYNFEEKHFTQNFNIIKFAEITNSINLPIYKPEEKENIISEIKNYLKEDENNFMKFLDNWINLVKDLIVEFLKFKLKKITYYYYCNVCQLPFFYFSDYIEEGYIDENNNNLMIRDSISAFNELMEIINVHQYKNSSEKIKEYIVNVICYEEEYNYMNYSFENEINGTFIVCSNLKNFNKIMTEINDKNILIENKNSKISSKIKFNITNNYMFDLIISAIYIDKVFQYLINNNLFRLIKGICILIDHKGSGNNININYNLLTIKKKYNDYLKDIYVEQNDIFLFLKNEKVNVNHRNNNKYIVNNSIINYINYNIDFLNFHKESSLYYNKYPTYSAHIFHDIILDFLKSIDIIKQQFQKSKISKQNNSKNSSASKKHKINKLIEIFNKIKQNISISEDNYQNITFGLNTLIKNNIEKYEQNLSLFINDFNLWLNNSDNLSHEKLSYYTGVLIFTIDAYLYSNHEYYNINNENINEKTDDVTLVLYKEFLGNYFDVLFHENNKYKIITFPYFLLCSTKLKNIKNPDTDKYYIIYIIKYSLKNIYEYFQILFNLDEETKVFQMFTFFRVTDVKINKKAQKAIIYLEPINKKECHELKLKNDDAIIYNYDLNIMETIKYDDDNEEDENYNNINNDNENENDNLYITATPPIYNNNEDTNYSKLTKYTKFFNNKFGTNLNPELSSLSLEEMNVKNLGLVILSKTNLENLIVLNLSKNNISDISPLENCKCPKLKKLSLESDPMSNPQDKIQDISPLIHTKFPELFILNLKHNCIKDISYLLFMNFPNLIILDLSYNQIESVYVFNEVNFPNLETLDLSYNLITDITPFISSCKKSKSVKNIDSSTFLNSSTVSTYLNKSIANSESIKKNSILPSLKILKIKNNKIIIDEGYLNTIKALKNRGITIYK